MTFIVEKSKTTDFGGNFSSGQLHGEIQNSVNISTELKSVLVEEDDVYIKFVSEPSVDELSALDALITNHTYVPNTTKGTNIFTCAMGSDFSMKAGNWTKWMSFIYQGSNIVDPLTACQVYAWKDSSVTNYRFRLQDVINNKTIFTSELQTNTEPAIINGGTSSNIPEKPTVLEFQLEVTGGSGKDKKAYVGCVSVIS